MSDQVAAVHFTPAFGAVEANRARLVELADEAAQDAAVVVLPELATTGFCLTLAQAAAWAEPLDGPTPRALAAVARAHQAVIVVGLALREDGGTLRNAALVLDADGSLAGVYAKHHLFAQDHAWATRGSRPGAVVPTRAGRVGVLICHDLVYLLTVLAVLARRPRLVAFPTAWIEEPDPARAAPDVPESWRAAARLLGRAPLVAANRGGQELEGAVRFDDPSAIVSGHTAVVGPAGVEPAIVRAPLP